MLFSRQALGIDIHHDGAHLTVAVADKRVPKLVKYAIAEFPAETVRPSLREPNVVNPGVFVARLREAYLQLLTNVRRVSVSLPDSAGRVVLLNLETRFKNRAEGVDIIRWKLKKNFPLDINLMHLDYQIVQEKENGELAVLVSLIARDVIKQYEDLLLEAGVQPAGIDFTSFNIYRLFAPRLELTENVALVTWYGGTVGLLFFHAGMLEFYRAKEFVFGTGDSNRLFREINGSVLAFREKYPGHTMDEVYCFCPREDAGSFLAVVGEATGRDPLLLDVEKVITCAEGTARDGMTLFRLAAALGAATRSF